MTHRDLNDLTLADIRWIRDDEMQVRDEEDLYVAPSDPLQYLKDRLRENFWIVFDPCVAALVVCESLTHVLEYSRTDDLGDLSVIKTTPTRVEFRGPPDHDLNEYDSEPYVVTVHSTKAGINQIMRSFA